VPLLAAIKHDEPMRGARPKQMIRALMHQAGLELPRRNGLRSTMAAALAPVARQFAPGTVIDVGVAWGTPGLLRAFPNARLLLIEPLEEFEDALQRLADRRGARVVRAAVGRQPGALELNVTTGLSDTSSYRSVDDVCVQRRTVPVTTVDLEVARWGLPGPYLLKIDVQGAELDVLCGATNTLQSTEVVLLEASLFDLYEGAPDVTAVIRRLDDLGFVLYDVFGGDRRPLDGALAQVDLVFSRRDGTLRRAHSYRSRPAANAAP
jgi:FkbM family methyltransferase